jgi:hypothetical protein
MSVEILSHYRLQFAHRKQVVTHKKNVGGSTLDEADWENASLSLFRHVLPRWKRNGSKRSEAFSEEQAVIDPIEGQRAEDNREAENASFLKNLTFRASQASKREENSNWDNIVPVAPLLKTGFSSHLLHGSTSSQPTDDAIDQLGSSKVRSVS